MVDCMNTTAFTQQVKAMSHRLTNLYETINTSSLVPSALLSSVTELGITSERLEIAAKMLNEQNQKLSSVNQTVTLERQRYQELLEFIPDACLLTDAAGVIQETNSAASKLLNLSQCLLSGWSLTAFITPETQQQFQTQLQQLQKRHWKQQWQIRLQPYRGVAFDANVVVEVSHQSANQPFQLRWLLRHTSKSEAIDVPECNINLSYASHTYHKGEIIPLKPESIWLVRSGLVKLTTFCASGEEVLVGLAGEKAPFGSSLTSLPLYEATALSDTQLWCIPLSDATSFELMQHFLPQISQRLKQTESLLAIYGQVRVADRLDSLLELLKQEIGESVADGTRLVVRLTHQDLASACCTTRVTITRMLNELQKQNKLSVDKQRHLTLKT